MAYDIWHNQQLKSEIKIMKNLFRYSKNLVGGIKLKLSMAVILKTLNE